ncbi:DUF4440 domain-containing protein [Nocardia sp. X0981]
MSERPTLGDPRREVTAKEVAIEFARQLEISGEASDADGYDAAFATDILWGSPYGASVTGYAELNALHHRLMAARVAPPSRFEVVTALSPAPGVVVTQIRRQAIDTEAFSEMAMYVLVERNGRWWLAAAQNTPVGTSPLQREAAVSEG